MQKRFTKITDYVARKAGHSITFILAVLSIVLWLVFGPITGYSDSWMLWINTGTTIITFLMGFIIQSTQNRDNKAIHAKLDDIIYHLKGVDNKFIGAEKLEEKDIDKLQSQIKEKK